MELGSKVSAIGRQGASAPTPSTSAQGNAKAERQGAALVAPDAIRLMGQRIAADKFEHCTADPIFTVMKRRLITGLDLDYDREVGWFRDGDQITSEDAAALEAAYQEDFKVPGDYTRTGIAEEWEHHATYVTMEAAEEFVSKKGDQYRVYVDSGCRNHEWQALRAFLLEIAKAPAAAPTAGDAQTAPARDVLAERQRQIIGEGFITARDDGYTNLELADAAAQYALQAGSWPSLNVWPWNPDTFKEGIPREMLVKAGALILAEIERLDRAA